MKELAYFVITARGGIYDEVALEDVLRAGRIAGAGLDGTSRSRRRRTPA